MSGKDHIKWEPLYRVKFTTDPAVKSVIQPVNASAAALVQLQTLVADLLKRVEKLEADVT